MEKFGQRLPQGNTTEEVGCSEEEKGGKQRHVFSSNMANCGITGNFFSPPKELKFLESFQTYAVFVFT